MKNKKYESPKVTFVHLHANESIANECWKYAGKPSPEDPGDDPLFYDTPNAGYVKFSVYGDGDCGAKNPKLKYVIKSYIKPNGDSWTDEEKEAAASAFDTWFENHARPKGPSFNGTGFSENTPGGNWS